MHAVFLDYATVSNGDLDTTVLRDAVPDVRFHATTPAPQIPERIGGADIVLLNKATLTRGCLSAAERLKLVVLAGTGTDNVDLTAAQERGIAVCNVRNYCTPSVAQHAWALILSLTRRLPEYSRLATTGPWSRGDAATMLSYPLRELNGRTLGVIGWGELGRAVAAPAEAFGMRVVIANRRGQPPQPGRIDLEELLAAADVVSLHCPLNAATRGMLGARELACMKPDALLINTARGALVDPRALAEALKAGRIGGAGIDVLAQEPPVDGNPLLDPDIPNLILTPHVAWAAREARQRCLGDMAANIGDFLSGGRRGRVV
jgi:glycerate dehydrogenase